MPEQENIQSSICHWAEAAFGPVRDPLALYRRAQLEMDELQASLQAKDDSTLIAGELADVLILLYRLAQESGVDLDAAVKQKLAINKAREWQVTGDGTGQHK